jgi:hypothetical protein
VHPFPLIGRRTRWGRVKNAVGGEIADFPAKSVQKELPDAAVWH